MTIPLLTEGDVERGAPPDLRRLQAIAALAPHLPASDWMWNQVVDWAARHLDSGATALFIQHRQQARELRGAGHLPDSHTLTSWALHQARHDVNRRRQEGCQEGSPLPDTCRR